MQLSVLGYAHPGVEQGEDYDPYHEDFLVIKIEVATPRGSWKATKPALLTMEARELSKWLGMVAIGADLGDNLEFFDPLLYFEYGAERNGIVTLRIGFGLEFRPPWAEAHQVDAQDHLFEFEVSSADLKVASTSLSADLERFPTRWKPSRTA